MNRMHESGWSRGERDDRVVSVQATAEMEEHSGRRDWDQEAARLALRRQVMDHLASPEGVLVLLEADFVKDSSAYIGAQRYADTEVGRVEHRQTGVFLAYTSPKGEGYLDRELFLPRVWTEKEALRRAAGMPAQVTFATRPQMARRMLERAIKAGVPHRSVVGGPTFGLDAGLRLWLEEQGESYLLGVPGGEVVTVGRATLRAAAIVSTWPAEAWRIASDPVSAAQGEAWAGVRVQAETPSGWERWLLARRPAWDVPASDCYLTFVREQTRLEEMIAGAEAVKRTNTDLWNARRTVGLDRFCGRSWEGWYRHMTVALMAHAMRTMVRRYAASAM